MVKCPKCGAESGKPAREWVGGAKTSKPMKVQKYVCGSCGSNFVAWTDSKTGAVRAMTRKS